MCRFCLQTSPTRDSSYSVALVSCGSGETGRIVRALEEIESMGVLACVTVWCPACRRISALSCSPHLGPAERKVYFSELVSWAMVLRRDSTPPCPAPSTGAGTAKPGMAVAPSGETCHTRQDRRESRQTGAIYKYRSVRDRVFPFE